MLPGYQDGRAVSGLSAVCVQARRKWTPIMGERDRIYMIFFLNYTAYKKYLLKTYENLCPRNLHFCPSKE